MIRLVQRLTLAAALGAFAHASLADETGFDAGMSGKWTGGGEVLQKITDERPLTVKCEFDMSAEGTAFDLDGQCGVLFVKRAIKLSLEREGEAVAGTYDAKLRTGEATLAGLYDTEAMALEIEWGGDVNGDTMAEMAIERPDEDTLRIKVTDIDPATGEDVVTSDLTLTRAS